MVAALLQQQGHELIGVMLQLRSCSSFERMEPCCGGGGLERAQAVADRLGIPFHIVNCTQAFHDCVLAPAWNSYAQGKTPSPCLWCNEYLKFGILLDWAKEHGADLVATGHYARLDHSDPEHPILRRAVDPAKDQSYFLAGLTRKHLRSILFPLGGMTKPQVRILAEQFGLPTAQTPDSQDACLVGDGASFAENLRCLVGAPQKCGKLIDADGKILAQHQGIHNFTIGQRKGLGIGTHLRRWVKELRPKDNTVVVTAQESDLDSCTFRVKDLVWTGAIPERCLVQVRSRHIPVPARISVSEDGTASVQTDTPIRAISPGQAAVFADGEIILGRGWIE